MNNQDTHDTLIDQIVDIELEMFQGAISTIHSPCQERIKTFRSMRWMHHSVSTQETLESHLYDLTVAKIHGRNLMTEKYARMENKIPPLNEHPAIETIASIEVLWMSQYADKKTSVFNGDHEGFIRYISAELETLSKKTLELILQSTLEAKANNINLVELRYNNLFERYNIETA